MTGFYADDLVKLGRTTTRPKRDVLYIGIQRYVYTAVPGAPGERNWLKSGIMIGDLGRMEWARQAGDVGPTAQRATAVVLVSVYEDMPEPTFDCTIMALQVPGVNTDGDAFQKVAPKLSGLYAAVEAWMRACYAALGEPGPGLDQQDVHVNGGEA